MACVSSQPPRGIVALDLFNVPTATFRVLYCLFIIEHGRRRILHFNVTRHPSADWVVQQLRETFAEAAPYRYAILDRDSIFNADVLAFLQATGLQPKRTSIQSPWQNGTAERWIGSCRREILDHIIPVNEEHLRRLAQENSGWGAPKIHGELQKLGFVLSERTVARYLRPIQRAPQDPALQRYAAPLGRLGRAAVARNLCGGGSVSLYHSGSRFDLQW